MAKRESVDAESREILEEMEADGIDTSSLTGGEKVVDSPDSKEEEESESEVHSPELEESEDETEEEEDDESDESESDSGEEEEEDDESEEGEPEKTGKKLTLVQKYQRTRKLLKDTQAVLGSLQAAKGDEKFDADLKAFAEKNGMEVEVARGLIEFAARKNSLPKDVLEDIQRSRSERRNTEYWGDQHKKFDRDFKDNVVPVLQQLGLKQEDIDATYKTLNEDSTSPLWAWDKKNKSSSLVKLALSLQRGEGEGHKRGTRISSESSARRFRNGASQKAVEDMTADDIENLSDEEFDKLSDDLGKKSKSVVHRA